MAGLIRCSAVFGGPRLEAILGQPYPSPCPIVRYQCTGVLRVSPGGAAAVLQLGNKMSAKTPKICDLRLFWLVGYVDALNKLEEGGGLIFRYGFGRAVELGCRKVLFSFFCFFLFQFVSVYFIFI